MGYSTSTSYKISSLDDELHYAIPGGMKRGLSTWYHSTVTGTTPIITLCGTRFITAALIREFEANEDGRSTWLVLLH